MEGCPTHGEWDGVTLGYTPATTMVRLFVALAFLVVGCSPSGDGFMTDSVDARRVSLQSRAGEPVDLEFHPLDWAPGERLVVEVGLIRLRSTARGAGHAVDLYAPDRRVLRVVGLLDGAETSAFSVGDVRGVDGGVTTDGPTSIHRATVCQGNTCTEVIEYDYDRTDGSGNGTTNWSPTDDEEISIDRLRFELEASPGTGAMNLDVTPPSVLRVAH